MQVDSVRKRQSLGARKPCSNCGTNHQPKPCPAYKDTCSFCKNKVHWSKCCRKKKRSEASKKETATPHKRFVHKPKIHAVHEDTESSDNDCTPFHSIRVNTLKSCDKSDEAFVTLKMSYPDPHVKGDIRLKVDTGSGGNKLPLRTYRQMFGDIPTSEILKREPEVKLTSYSGDVIPCLGSIKLSPRR